MASFAAPSEQVYLVFGKTGWIGGMLIELLEKQGKKYHLAESRTYDRESVLAEIQRYKPTHILNAAGVTGRPNVDWCEDHKVRQHFEYLNPC
jgi:3,5-epimerase/4-reductase